MIEYEITESDRRLKAIFFFLGAFFGINIGKLLFDEKYRYYLYVNMPDIIHSYDKHKDELLNQLCYIQQEYKIPTSLSKEEFGEFLDGIKERRLQRRAEKDQEKEKRRKEGIKERIETDVYLIKMEGKYNEEIDKQRQELLKRLE